MDLKKSLELKAKEIHKQYTVYSNKTSFINSIQYTVYEVRAFVESLDGRLYRNPQFLPFYCKAARQLGFGRMLELAGMVTGDPRIDQPSRFCPERVFCYLLRTDLRRKGL